MTDALGLCSAIFIGVLGGYIAFTMGCIRGANIVRKDYLEAKQAFDRTKGTYESIIVVKDANLEILRKHIDLIASQRDALLLIRVEEMGKCISENN